MLHSDCSCGEEVMYNSAPYNSNYSHFYEAQVKTDLRCKTLTYLDGSKWPGQTAQYRSSFICRQDMQPVIYFRVMEH